MRALLFACWFSKYGMPEKIKKDLGGEFTGEKWLMMMDILHIRNRTTAGYSPFSKGIFGRQNAVMKITMSKVSIEEQIEFLQTADVISYSLMFKNSLLNRKGFSPFQIAFGRTYGKTT